MKAVILAGGEGTRLRPISAECPKPMVRIFDKPLMEHSLELLRKHGFTDITVTLRTMPQKVMDYFGDGSSMGVSIRYSIEKEPLGTAGGVRAALLQCNAVRSSGMADGRDDSPSNEPVLVMSGDAVTDFNLRAVWEAHCGRNPAATMVLTRHTNVREYGLVMTEGDGYVTRFIEKPSWGQVFTDAVNTGIYILSPGALQKIPEGKPFDFARDLFPMMLSEGVELYGVHAEGYWCDVGDSAAYLQCCRDVLDGRAGLNLPMRPPVPAGVVITQPCYIGQGVSFGRDVRIGPYAVIGEGSRLGDGVLVENSVVDGAVLEAKASCRGAFIGKNAVLREGGAVRERAVLGEGVIVGENAEVLESAHIWPRKEIAPHSRVSGSIAKGMVTRGAVFEGGGEVRGLPHVDITPDFCLKLGLAAALTVKGEVGLSWQGGEAARIAALALETGVAAGGARAVQTDALTPCCAAFAGRTYNLPLSVFIKQEGRLLTLHFFGRDGLCPGRELERKLESATLRGDVTLADPQALRASRSVSGLAGLYAAAAAAPPPWAHGNYTPVVLSVAGGGPGADILRRALSAAGCVSGTRRDDGPVLSIDGFSLSARLSDGREAGLPRLLGMVILVEAACGESQIALPYDAPAFLDDVGARQGVRILRVGRDGERAVSLLADQPFMRDPVFMAARLAHGCRKLKTTLDRLDGQIPSFFLSSGEVPVTLDRGAVMRELARKTPGAELWEGVRTRSRGGWVRVTPLANRRAFRVIAEGFSEELAEEICVEFMQKVRMLGSDQK